MFCVIREHFDLVIARKLVHEGHSFETTCIVDHYVRDWEWKVVLWTSQVTVPEVYADSDLSIRLGDGNNISYPIWVLFLANEAAGDKFVHLCFDGVHDVRSEPLLLLLDRLSIRPYVSIVSRDDS